jgi:CheY-like chemotaxis protein
MAPSGPILNVDDHAPARFVRTRILERAGFGVNEVASASAAIERAPGASLVLLDIHLPDGDGFDVCTAVKRASPHLPVVMITSVYRTASARRDAFAVGADAFLIEPVNADLLVRTVESLTTTRTALGPKPVDCWIVTDAAGRILEVSPAGAALLNLSARGARGRDLTAFFAGDRPRLQHEMLRAADGVIVEREAMLQPRDRRPRSVRLDISSVPTAPGERVQLRWVVATE